MTHRRRRRRPSVGVLFSGGLDSAALILHYSHRNVDVWPVYASYGLPWESTELRWARRFLRSVRSPRVRPLRVVRRPLPEVYRGNWSVTGRTPGARSPDRAVYLPARNLLLVMNALLTLIPRGVQRVALGTLNGNPFPDGRPAYFRQLGRLMSQSFGRRIQIDAPFRRLRKRDLLRRYPPAKLSLSLSCVHPTGRWHCGRCNKCAERRKAFREARVVDGTRYGRAEGGATAS